jgi:predicted ATP-grasp superfamily ATP-dependent carboligase
MRRAEPVLICALSARALADAARAAGFAPIVLDAFGDLDMRAVAAGWQRIPVDGSWRPRRGPLLAAAARLAPPPVPLVWGSGFERAPRLIAELAIGRELWGNAPEMVRAVKDPLGFAATTARLDIPHPEVRDSRPTDPDSWLAKRVGAAGGGHVRPATRRTPRGRGWYWQRRAAGAPLSALVVGNGDACRVLAFAHQLLSPSPDSRYRFGGTLAPAVISPIARERLEEAALRLAAHYGLRGLASVDALVEGDVITVLELNPRPGGSLDAYRAVLELNLFAEHVAACRDRVLPTPVLADRVSGSFIVYATRATLVQSGFVWPEWAVDRSPGGTVIRSGGPICTVLARGAHIAEVGLTLARRANLIRGALCAPEGRRSDRLPSPRLWLATPPL